MHLPGVLKNDMGIIEVNTDVKRKKGAKLGVEGILSSHGKADLIGWFDNP